MARYNEENKEWPTFITMTSSSQFIIFPISKQYTVVHIKRSPISGVACEEDYNSCSESPCHALTECTDLTPAEELNQGVGFECSACPDGYDQISGCLGILYNHYVIISLFLNPYKSTSFVTINVAYYSSFRYQ